MQSGSQGDNEDQGDGGKGRDKQILQMKYKQTSLVGKMLRSASVIHESRGKKVAGWISSHSSSSIAQLRQEAVGVPNEIVARSNNSRVSRVPSSLSPQVCVYLVAHKEVQEFA